MKYYILLLPLLLFTSCETFQVWRKPAGAKPKHYIFSIHGLGGEPKSLGQLMPLLKSNVSQVDSTYDVVIKDFGYSTGVKEADVERFVSEFENFMIAQLPDMNDASPDKVTLVTHSQGGLVGVLWYLKSLHGVDTRQKIYAEKVNGFVAVGVPFWGSRTTFVLKDFIPSKYLQNMIFNTLKISDQEVTDITASSQKIYAYFHKFAAANTVNIYHDPRMLNIIGVVPRMNSGKSEKSFLAIYDDFKDGVSRMFDRRLNMGIRWESDQAVNASSGRLGFYHYSDTLYQMVHEKKPEQVTMNDFDYSRFFKTDSKVVFSESVHSYASNHPKYAMAMIPEECFEPAKCEHPTYVDIFKHVANCETAQSTCDMKKYNWLVNQLNTGKNKIAKQTSEQIFSEMRTFSLGLKITLPKSFVPPADLLDAKKMYKYIVADYVYSTPEGNLLHADQDGLIKSHPSQNYHIRLGRYREWGGRIVNYDAATNTVNIQFAGNIMPKTKDGAFNVRKQYPLNMVVRIPGLKPRKLTIPLQPSYTTFLDLVLD